MIIKKIKKYLFHPSYILAKLDDFGIIRLSDEKKIKIRYKECINKNINLVNPTGFNEKLQWLKLNDRKEIYTIMVDKYDVKNYVGNIIGKEYIIPTIGVYDKFEEIKFEDLPNQFVIKCTHDSGSTIICRDKESFNINKARKKINKKLKRNFYIYGREWVYKNIKPRVIIEPYLYDGCHDELTDYKIMCFNGKVKCSFVCLNRNSKKGLNVDFYDLNWKKMPFERGGYRNSNETIEIPQNYNLMIEFSEKLAKNIPFVRIDFYDIKGKLYFGEITFFPGCGFEKFEPEIYDNILGNWIKL